jgi:DNA-binding IclR family transcriptional regulator
LDATSRRAIGAASNNENAEMTDEPELSVPDVARRRHTDAALSAEDALWLALIMAPDEGCDIGELLRVTEMSRPTLYRHLGQLAKSGHAVQVGRGRWRAATTQEPSQ